MKQFIINSTIDAVSTLMSGIVVLGILVYIIA